MQLRGFHSERLQQSKGVTWVDSQMTRSYGTGTQLIKSVKTGTCSCSETRTRSCSVREPQAPRVLHISVTALLMGLGSQCTLGQITQKTAFPGGQFLRRNPGRQEGLLTKASCPLLSFTQICAQRPALNPMHFPGHQQHLLRTLITLLSEDKGRIYSSAAYLVKAIGAFALHPRGFQGE